MRARIIKQGTFYVGQVYGTWQRYMLGVYVGEWTGWKSVTENCLTSLGARNALNNWKRKQRSKEFEL